jgi:hypothetical protein
MTWVKLDDRYATHRKLLAAGAVAIALDVAGMCYCAGHNTDGHIPTVALTAAAPFLTRAAATAAAARLVAAGRWKPVADGWLIHDYLIYNPSAAEAEADRTKRAEATARWRARQRGDASRGKGGDASRDDTETSRDDDVSKRDRAPAPRGLKKPKGELLQPPPPRDASHPDASPAPPDTPPVHRQAAGDVPATPDPDPSLATTNGRPCRHRNDPAECAICSDAPGSPPPRSALDQALGRVRDAAAADPKATP